MLSYRYISLPNAIVICVIAATDVNLENSLNAMKGMQSSRINLIGCLNKLDKISSEAAVLNILQNKKFPL
jgi:hypothetical protein